GLDLRRIADEVLWHRSALLLLARDPLQGRQARHEEIFAAAEHVERLDSVDAAPHGVPWDSECRLFLLPLQPDDGVALTADRDEVAFVDPLLLQEFHGGHRLGADEQEVDAAGDLVGLHRQRVGIVGWSIGRPAPNDAVYVHIRQPGELRVPRVHAPDVASERRLTAARVPGVIEIVVPVRIRAERGIVHVRSQGQRSAAAPATHQLRGQQFPLFLRGSMRVEESIEGAHARLILAQTHKGPVAAEYVRLRHRQRNPGLARISEDELARPDRPSLTRQRIDVALDRRLVDAVFVPQRIEVPRLRTEVLYVQDLDPGEALVLLAGDSECTAPLFLRVAESGHTDVDL